MSITLLDDFKQKASERPTGSSTDSSSSTGTSSGGSGSTIIIYDDKTKYALQKGAEFASGFFYAARVGGFDDHNIYECLLREPNADQIFLSAD